MIDSVRINRNVPMEMRDGTLLRADIYRQDDNQKHPAILLRTPYDKSLRAWRHDSFLNFVEAAHAGYAIVIQDVRGRFASDGEWIGADKFTGEGLDGYDSVEWIASQPWCDGNVGMSGISWMASLQWMAAQENPPHLKAIAPGGGGMASVGVGMQPPRESGAISPAVLLSGIPMTSLEVADRLEREGEDVTEMRRTIEWVESNPEEALYFLPLKDLPLLRFKQIRDRWNKALQLVPETEQKKHQRYEKVTVPCLQMVGWYDTLEWTAFEAFKNMRERGGAQIAREAQHLLIGPWWHLAWTSYLGAINFGASADMRRAMISEQNITFYDRYLRGKDVEIPTVRYFLMGKNIWKTADTWPPPETQWQRFYLHSNGNANTAAGDGRLSRDEPGSESPDTFIYDPHNPVPTVGGSFYGTGLVPGPLEQYYIEKRSDVLCYTTPELKEDLEVTGPLEIHLFAATTARDTDFTARVVDVYPDGRAYNLVDGIKRARALKSVDQPELINPGEVYEYVISTGNTSNLFRKGHRIRIQISSSNFPMFDRNMNTGNPIGEDTRGIIANQSIYHNSEYPSYIDLPVIPR
ncbi:CocE/NonD family hydrolase [Thermodesulfobacteriota bacterium]